MPCGASGEAKTLSCPFSPRQVANDGYFLSRYRGMNQPMWPVSPFEPSSTTLFCFAAYCLYCATCCQSSSTASTLPCAIAWYTGISAMSVTFTLQPRYFSSTYLATYVFAVEPVHACSFSVTVPQPAFVRAVALPATTSTPIAAAAARSAQAP